MGVVVKNWFVGVCVCVFVWFCSPGAASQSNLKMKHLAHPAKIFQIFLHKANLCFYTVRQRSAAFIILWYKKQEETG